MNLFLLGSLAASACGGEPSKPAENPVVTQIAPDASAPEPADTRDAGRFTQARDAGAAVTPTEFPSMAPLPPAKPATIALGAGGTLPGDADLDAGDAAFERGDNAEAGKRYEAAKVAAPRRAAPAVGLARVRIAKLGLPMDYAAGKGSAEVLAASRDLKRAAQLETSFGPAYVELGRALLLAGDAPGAIGSLRRGVELLPSEAEAHSALGVALLATGNGDEAMAELRRAAELDPGSAARHGNYATALFMKGRVREAIAEYEQRVRLADGDARAHSDLGTALLANNEFARGIRELERAIAIDPRRATFRSNLGYALQLEGKVAEAIAQYRESIRLDDKLASAWLNLATALSRNPKTRAEARAALERARALDPSDPRVKANLDELDALEAAPRAAPDAGPRP